MTSPVTEIAPASADAVLAHYRQRLAFETDCADVHAAQAAGAADFVLCDVRGAEAYRRAHVPGAISLPVGKMSDRRMAEWPAETLFVVYCAGPHCNGTDKAAIRLASLGRKVKVMIGGMTGWADEGYAFEGEGAGEGLQPADGATRAAQWNRTAPVASPRRCVP